MHFYDFAKKNLETLIELEQKYILYKKNCNVVTNYLLSLLIIILGNSSYCLHFIQVD